MKRLVWLAVLVIAIGFYVGYGQMTTAAKKPEPGRRESRPAVPVTVVAAVQKIMPVQLEAVGTVEPYSTVSIRSQVTGAITKVHFQEGQDVKEGDLLFTVDPRPFEATLKQAEANLAKDTAMLANAREQARRYQELVKKQYVSQEQYDQIKTNADAIEATVDADKANVENAKVQLSYCRIYSPVTGRTGSLLVNEGNVVRTNDATPLVTINQVTPIYVTFALPEQNLPQIKSRLIGGKLTVQAVLPQGQQPEQGDLSFIDNSVDRTTGTIKLKGTFRNGERRLWPGQFVKAVLKLTDQEAIVVPSDAVQTGQQGQQVFVVRQDSAVDVRPVVVSRSLNGESVIEKGLQAGERVVTDGQFLLAPGSRIQIKTANSPNPDQKGGAQEGARRKKETAS
ncbi:MAG TPA: efflux RND transporter periplasmic adaptor subunit [Verrucomicrobiae bacterium]|jgi:membrane fusion protein, multidrug efflux system|nr:efflux RND transporter periplasmic adaptor subunit [Verrucomicrobiae bacterium]